MTEPGAPPKEERQQVLIKGVRWGLLVLTLINLVNYLDRFVVAALFESLRKSDLHLDDLQLGALGPAFMIVYMATSPFFGALGDRKSRTRLIALGVAIWSVATGLAGFATSFLFLYLARAAVGVGEAAYGTISPSLLADYFPKSRRGMVFAVFFCAIPVGSALGYIVGGLMDQHFGWRAAFFAAGAPGLALALFTLWLPDPPRGVYDDARERKPASEGGLRGLVATYGGLLRNGPYALTVLGYAAYTFVVGGMGIWLPTFLERERGVSPQRATVALGVIIVATGLGGTFFGGWLGDYLLKYSKQAYLWVSAVTALAAVPAAVVALTTRAPLSFFTAIVLAQIFLFMSTGPINSAIVNLVAPTERATAVALSIFTIHLLGDVPSPPLIGALSKATSLDRAILIIPAAAAVCGIIWVAAAIAQRKSGK